MKRFALMVIAVCAVGLTASTASAQHHRHGHRQVHHHNRYYAPAYGGYYRYPSYNINFQYGYPSCYRPAYKPYYPGYRHYGHAGYRTPYYGGAFYFGVRF